MEDVKDKKDGRSRDVRFTDKKGNERMLEVRGGGHSGEG